MSVAVSNMYSINIPRFGSASSCTKDDKSGANNQYQDINSSQGCNGFPCEDPLDFDLLAEYLLEDFTMSSPTPNNESKTNEGHIENVKHDNFAAAVASFADPLADAAMLLRQGEGSRPPSGDLAGDLVVQSQQIAPAPLAHPGMNVQAPAPSSMHIAPTVNTNKVGPPNIIVHQHAPPAPSSGAKRPYPQSAPPNTNGAANGLPAHLNLVATTHGQGKRQKSQAQIERRRERNRILARRTRLRKKFFFESLQKEVMELQRENSVLKEIVKKEMGDKSKSILEECSAGDLPSCITDNNYDNEDNVDLDKQDFNLVCSIKRSQQCFVITDPSLQDNPIVYASNDFLTLTGYSRDEILGRNCRFLQGTDTCPAKVEQIRKGLAAGEDVSVCFINYTADGTAFWNKLFIAALRDSQNNIVNYIGVTVKVAGPAPDDPEAGKLLPGQKGISEPKNGITSHEETNSQVNVEDTVKAMEGVVSAAVAAAPAKTPQSDSTAQTANPIST